VNRPSVCIRLCTADEFHLPPNARFQGVNLNARAAVRLYDRNM
jgi:hypothetical protein